MSLAASGEMSIGGSTVGQSINLEFGRGATQLLSDQPQVNITIFH